MTFKPREELLKDWLAALRSGKYAQGEGSLCSTGASGKLFCCLGVLCEVAGLEWEDNDGSHMRTYKTGDSFSNSYVPLPLAKHMGMHYQANARSMQYFEGPAPKRRQYVGLINMNDSGGACSFTDIADTIEQQHDKLFDWAKAADTPVSAGPPTLLGDD